MASLNRITLIGAVGKDPEVRQFQDGGSICTFTLATSETYTDRNGQRQEQTEWHNVVLNGKLANLAQFLRKGSKLYVEGKLHNRSWQSQDGQKHYVTEVNATGVQLLDPKPQTAQPAAPAPQYAPRPAYPPQYQQPAPAPVQYAPQTPPPPAPAPAPQAPAYRVDDPNLDLPF